MQSLKDFLTANVRPSDESDSEAMSVRRDTVIAAQPTKQISEEDVAQIGNPPSGHKLRPISPPDSADYALHSERRLDQRARNVSSNAYDRNVLSKIGADTNDRRRPSGSSSVFGSPVLTLERIPSMTSSPQHPGQPLGQRLSTLHHRQRSMDARPVAQSPHTSISAAQTQRASRELRASPHRDSLASSPASFDMMSKRPEFSRGAASLRGGLLFGEEASLQRLSQESLRKVDNLAQHKHGNNVGSMQKVKHEGGRIVGLEPARVAGDQACTDVNDRALPYSPAHAMGQLKRRASSSHRQDGSNKRASYGSVYSTSNGLDTPDAYNRQPPLLPFVHQGSHQGSRPISQHQVLSQQPSMPAIASAAYRNSREGSSIPYQSYIHGHNSGVAEHQTQLPPISALDPSLRQTSSSDLNHDLRPPSDSGSTAIMQQALQPLQSLQNSWQVPAPPNSGDQQTGSIVCECCPKKPRHFDDEEDLRLHYMEKQYTCAYCPNRFKNKNEAERHQNSLHLRRQSWSCAAMANREAAFHNAPNSNGAHDICGYCGEEFPNPPQWDVRYQHVDTAHKFSECNQSKKFFRADHFRQHLKHSHAGASGKWTNVLETACMKVEPPPIPMNSAAADVRDDAGAMSTQSIDGVGQTDQQYATTASASSPTVDQRPAPVAEMASAPLLDPRITAVVEEPT